jgi:menaquinone-dependent protoporphyrinogen oxidase
MIALALGDALNILIVHGTTEGQTRKIAEWTETHIRDHGHQTELRDSAAPAPVLNLGTYDAFIIAASVHQEYHQEAITNFVIAHREVLDAKPSAFISVSLSVVLEGGEPEAQKYVDSFVSMTRWRPRMTLLLGGALRFAEYDYFQEQIVKFIVMKGGSSSTVREGGSSSTVRDREFTDWNALAGFVDGFLDAAAG